MYRQPVDVDEWEFDLRLVLLASDYAPHTDLEPPTGNILFIDDSSDLSLLASLNRAGVVDWITTLSAPEN